MSDRRWTAKQFRDNLNEIGNALEPGNDVAKAVELIQQRCMRLAIEAASGLTPNEAIAQRWDVAAEILGTAVVKLNKIL